jgi:hypothetical protein
MMRWGRFPRILPGKYGISQIIVVVGAVLLCINVKGIAIANKGV